MLNCVLAFLPGRQIQRQTAFGNLLVFAWLRLTCKVSIRFEGIENIPNEPTVYVCNHQSTCETFCLQRVLRPVSSVVKKSLLYVPFFGWTLYLMRPIAIDRGDRKSAMKQVLKKGMRRLQKGYNVVIYPEGTRRPYGGLGPFARSAAALAIHSGVPIVPVAHNAGRHWPHQFIKYPGTITIRFGPVFRDTEDSRSLTDCVRGWIEQQLQTL